jgi:zinc transport system substrate-binding protein
VFISNNIFRKLSLLIVLMMLLAACQPGPSQGTTDVSPILVTVSILPQAYFVERIAGDLVAVNVMVGPGEDPHTYEPKPEQMRALSNSQLFFTIGTEYEDAWLPRLREVNPELTFVDSAAGIQRIPLTDPHHHDDDDDDHHEDEADHGDETGLDPHVWLAPANGKLIARNTFTALTDHAPDHANAFQANYEALIADIDALDARIEEILAGVEGRAFMVFHPAWGYFADQYGLEQVPVQVGGQEPSASDMAALIAIAREENIRVIFVQPTFSTANARAIAQEINAKIAVADPLARDWLENLEFVADAFAAALGQ